jgi:hypothetical protein
MGFIKPRARFKKFIDISRTKRCKKLWCDIQCQEDGDTCLSLYCDECWASFHLGKSPEWEFDKEADAFVQRRKTIQPWMSQMWFEAYWWNDTEQERLITHGFKKKVEKEPTPSWFTLGGHLQW